jgi:glycosyltransferase involved in cell wall biosynthesis
VPVPNKRKTDLLFVSLGSTLGLRAADDQLIAGLRAAGIDVEVVHPEGRGDVRTMMLTDFLQAHAASLATRLALTTVTPRRVLYSTTTAAMCWPMPGAIRFDALARTLPRAVVPRARDLRERRCLKKSPLLIPWSPASLDGAPKGLDSQRQVVMPIAIADLSPEGPRADPPEGSVCLTYAADARKKGLDRVLEAWARARREGELLLVAGLDRIDPALGPTAGVRPLGRLAPADFRALMRGVGVYVTAPRREDYGIVQLEALAEGARVVTTHAPGPYAALPLVRDLWPEQVVDDADDPAALATALRFAIDAKPSAVEVLRATHAVDPWRPARVQQAIERELVPALGLAA